VGEALRLGQWGRACQLTCRLLGEGRLDPAKACRAYFPLLCIRNSFYNIFEAIEIEAASTCKRAGRAKVRFFAKAKLTVGASVLVHHLSLLTMFLQF